MLHETRDSLLLTIIKSTVKGFGSNCKVLENLHVCLLFMNYDWHKDWHGFLFSFWWLSFWNMELSEAAWSCLVIFMSVSRIFSPVCYLQRRTNKTNCSTTGRQSECVTYCKYQSSWLETLISVVIFAMTLGVAPFWKTNDSKIVNASFNYLTI